MSRTPVPHPPAVMSPARQWAATAVLSASLLVITMDMTILSLALPDMAADLHPSANQQLWIIDVYSLMLAGLLVPAAALADRWGRRRMLLVGYSAFAVASLLVLVADSAGEIIAIRALLGVGGSMIMPTTLSLIRIIFTDPARRATALGMWAAVSGLGLAIGPLVGGVLLEHFSWHAAFLFNVPLMVLGIIAGRWLLPRSRVTTPGRLDLIAAVLALGGMTSLVWAIKQFGKEASILVPQGLLALGLAIALLAWFTRRCLRSDHPLLDMGLFASRTFSVGIAAAFGSIFSLIAALVLVAQWLQVVGGASPIQAGVRLIPLAIAAAVSSLAAPPLARRFGTRGVLSGGILIAGLGLGIVTLPRVPWLGTAITGGELTMPVMVAALTVVGLGTGSLSIASAMIMSGSPEDRAGNAGALEETSYELGGTLGVAILGSISAVVYRAQLTANPDFTTFTQLAPDLAHEAQESLGAAHVIAETMRLPTLADAAGRAFSTSLEITGIVGAAVMVAVALAVFAVAPKKDAVLR